MNDLRAILEEEWMGLGDGGNVSSEETESTMSLKALA